MRVISVVEEKMEWEDVDKVVAKHVEPTPRSTGIHLSGILRALQIEAGLLKVREDGKWVGDTEDDDEVFPLRMAMGMAWEAWVAARYDSMIWQPGEIETDGIFGTPDGLTHLQDVPEIEMTEAEEREGQILVEEFKLTWMSYRERIQDVTKWIWQGMGYCKMWRTTYCRFNILYVNGNYKNRPFTPMYMRYLVEFTPLEIERFWKMVVKNKSKAKAEGLVSS